MLKKNKYEEHGSDFENKISKIDKKVPDISSLVKKTEYNKLFTKVNNIDTTDFVKKKNDYATEFTAIKNEYVTNAVLDARHEDLVQRNNI